MEDKYKLVTHDVIVLSTEPIDYDSIKLNKLKVSKYPVIMSDTHQKGLKADDMLLHYIAFKVIHCKGDGDKITRTVRFIQRSYRVLLRRKGVCRVSMILSK